jgi:hypothetical protein
VSSQPAVILYHIFRGALRYACLVSMQESNELKKAVDEMLHRMDST